jgi:hypothetical protein
MCVFLHAFSWRFLFDKIMCDAVANLLLPIGGSTLVIIASFSSTRSMLFGVLEFGKLLVVQDTR